MVIRSKSRRCGNFIKEIDPFRLFPTFFVRIEESVEEKRSEVAIIANDRRQVGWTDRRSVSVPERVVKGVEGTSLVGLLPREFEA